MKFIPILFSTPMVEAILQGRKTQTRRALRVHPDDDAYYIMNYDCATGIVEIDYNQGDDNPRVKCPYGQVGEILYVREEHYRYGHWEPDNTRKRKSGRQSWKFVADTEEFLFEQPSYFRKGRHHKDPYTPAWHKRAGVFMPKYACRIWLENTDIRVERLQDISEEDAIAEGIKSCDPICNIPQWFDYVNGPGHSTGWPCGSFASLWQSINGIDSFDTNPWVWVITFKRISKPSNW